MSNNWFKLLLRFESYLWKVGEIKIIHHEISETQASVKIESLIAANWIVAKFLNAKKISLQLQNVFLFYFELLDSIKVLIGFVLTFVDAPIAALSKFLQKNIFLQKRVVCEKIGWVWDRIWFWIGRVSLLNNIWVISCIWRFWL